MRPRQPRGNRSCLECGTTLPHGGVGESTTVIREVGGHDIATDRDLPRARADAHASVVESLAAGQALLVVENGPNAGGCFPLDQDVTRVGRHPDSAIFLDDVTVSRRDMEVRRQGSGFSAHNASSIHGICVNRNPVDVATLASGDNVQIGRFRLVYLTRPTSEAKV
jgi:hypothetical protein